MLHPRLNRWLETHAMMPGRSMHEIRRVALPAATRNAPVVNAAAIVVSRCVQKQRYERRQVSTTSPLVPAIGLREDGAIAR